jgi:large subunit ribosomal protein L23
MFMVTVEGVRTLIVRGKVKRMGRSIGKRANFKKAIVTLKEGDKIDLFEGGGA